MGLSESTVKFCISACVFVILINLSMNLVMGLNIFGTMAPSPFLNATNTSSITTIKSGGKTIDLESILTNNLLSVLTTSVSTALFLALAVRCYVANDYRILGPALFTLVFWNTWLMNISFFAASGYFSTGVMLIVFGMFTVPMILIFLGAVSGMLTGSE
jgi:hypothetical protein